MTPYDVAQLAFSIEREDLGLAGGGQDQYAAAFGGFNFIEFQSRQDVIVNSLRVHPALVRELESSMLLYFTGRSRDSSEVIRQQQRNMISHDPGAIEALRGLKLDALQMKSAILKGDVAALGRVLNTGWEQKKRTAAAVTTPEIDRLIEGVFEHGAYAAKLSGAGGGGFMFMLCEPTRRHELAKHLKNVGHGELLPCHFTEHGVESWRLS